MTTVHRNKIYAPISSLLLKYCNKTVVIDHEIVVRETRSIVSNSVQSDAIRRGKKALKQSREKHAETEP